MLIYSYCYVFSVLYILFPVCCSVYCLCVNVYCTAATVLCYKSEGRWFVPSWCEWIFH